MTMRRLNIIVTLSLLLIFSGTYAGNEDRAGEAGASELLINPWTRSSGWGGANTAAAKGIEAMNLNVAGLSFVRNSELIVSNTRWLGGTGINIFSAGLAQKLGESGGVLGLTFTSFDFGEIDVTTVDQPDGGFGTFDPGYLNIGLAYSRRFSNSISGGLVVRLVTQNTADLNATGVAIDAGVNYTTGENDAFKFGITLRNVGPPMKYSGNGLSFRSDIPNSDKTLTVSQRSSDFELPSLVNIGASYDFFLTEVSEDENEESYADHRITASGTFTSNSFSRDQLRLGAEYAFQEMFMARVGYVYEEEALDEELSRTTTVGPTFGATIEVPLGRSGSTLGIDYSYRVTRTFDGSNAIGLRLTF